ncbi:IclR family transcriptional regulator [Ruicaihuangia caeni]|uniref:IclR family transcriptional regulator n=1 Tax=Ruicaihuangia caeni TaxID=3042517 RepID=UPI00338D7E3A
MAGDDGGGGATRSVDRAMRVLKAVVEAPEAATLSEIAREVELSPSTTLRLLGTLAHHDFIRRDDSGRYHAGIGMKQLAASALRDDPVYDLSGHFLDELVSATGETASLGVPMGSDEVLYLRQIPSTREVQSIVWTGRVIPRRGTALGRALDAQVAPHGYVVSHRSDSDVVAAAVPVFGPTGSIVGALSINAPAYRTGRDDVERFGRELVKQGEALSRALGAP